MAVSHSTTPPEAEELFEDLSAELSDAVASKLGHASASASAGPMASEPPPATNLSVDSWEEELRAELASLEADGAR